MNSADVICFWFDEIEPSQRFKKDTEIDRLILERFSDLHHRVRNCELHRWREEPLGALAEIIVLDQFSRNMFRDTPQAFAYDGQALTLAQEMVRRRQDRVLAPGHKVFAYMPYMHSESPKIHQAAMLLYDQPGLEESFKYEMRHKEVIDRFGRFPHRNEILGRQSTPEELEFLKLPGSRF
jgi:uncharacterized protein (DUF924 family)